MMMKEEDAEVFPPPLRMKVRLCPVGTGDVEGLSLKLQLRAPLPLLSTEVEGNEEKGLMMKEDAGVFPPLRLMRIRLGPVGTGDVRTVTEAPVKSSTAASINGGGRKRREGDDDERRRRSVPTTKADEDKVGTSGDRRRRRTVTEAPVKSSTAASINGGGRKRRSSEKKNKEKEFDCVGDAC